MGNLNRKIKYKSHGSSNSKNPNLHIQCNTRELSARPLAADGLGWDIVVGVRGRSPWGQVKVGTKGI